MPLDLTPIREAYQSERVELKHVAALLNEVQQLQVAHDFQLDRHTKCWDALCDIGEALDRAGYPVLIPERALKVGEQVDALIGDVGRLRAAVRLEWHGSAEAVDLCLCLGNFKAPVLQAYPGQWAFAADGRFFGPSSEEVTKARLAEYVQTLGLPCPLPPFPVVHPTLTPPGGAS